MLIDAGTTLAIGVLGLLTAMTSLLTAIVVLVAALVVKDRLQNR